MLFGLFGKNRQRQRLDSYAGLIDFLDSRSAFLAQKCVYEYCRARSGLNWDKMMREKDFLDAYEISRWDSYGAALADLVVHFEGLLRPDDPRQHARLIDRLIVAAVEVLQRYPVPAHRSDGWAGEIAGLRERLKKTQLSQPAPAAEVSRTAGARIYACLPLHRDMTKHDRILVTNAVRFNFCRIAADLEEELDRPALLAELLGETPPVAPSAAPL